MRKEPWHWHWHWHWYYQCTASPAVGREERRGEERRGEERGTEGIDGWMIDGHTGQVGMVKDVRVFKTVDR
jgi:hypothetical protein